MTFESYKGRTLVQMKIRANQQNAEIERLRALVTEVLAGDWTDALYAAELPSRLAESEWFKRARAALNA